MLRPGQALGLCVLALLMIGVVMVNSAGMSVDAKGAVTIESIVLSKSTAYMGLAVLAMLVIGVMPVRKISDWGFRISDLGSRKSGHTSSEALAAVPKSEIRTPKSGLPSPRHLLRHYLSLWPLWLAVLGLLGLLGSVYVKGIGREVNHSHRWLNLHLPGLDSVQPSEFVKWGLIGVIAWYCCRNQRRMSSFWYGLLPGLAAAGIVAAGIVVEDLGTGALVGMVATLMLLAAGARVWHLVLLAPVPLAGVALAVVTSPYRLHRITSFLNPYEDAQGKGYHMIQSMVAVANGQFFGRGLGHGLQKFGYLPEDTTDFLFAVICEELGVFGAALVIFLYGTMLWTCLAVIKREPSPLLRLVGLGVTATVGLQAIINLAVVTGLGPTKGIALPLLSSGGTGWILTAASLGLVIAMDRTQGVMQWYRVPSGVKEEEAGADAAAAAAPTESIPSSADGSRFAPSLAMAATGGVEAATIQPIGSETGMLFGAESEVVVTDDGRDWPDAARLRPA